MDSDYVGLLVLAVLFTVISFGGILINWVRAEEYNDEKYSKLASKFAVALLIGIILTGVASGAVNGEFGSSKDSSRSVHHEKDIRYD